MRSAKLRDAIGMSSSQSWSMAELYAWLPSQTHMRARCMDQSSSVVVTLLMARGDGVRNVS